MTTHDDPRPENPEPTSTWRQTLIDAGVLRPDGLCPAPAHRQPVLRLDDWGRVLGERRAAGALAELAAHREQWEPRARRVGR